MKKKKNSDCDGKSLKDPVILTFTFPDITLRPHLSLHMAQLAKWCLFNHVYSIPKSPQILLRGQFVWMKMVYVLLGFGEYCHIPIVMNRIYDPLGEEKD